MKRIFLIDNGCYSTKCSVINYDPSTATGTEEVRTFPTALDYIDGEYNIINEDNGGASIIRYFRAFFGMTKDAAQVKAEKLFPFMDFVYDNNGFAAISLSEGSNPVSCVELTREYVKKLYEKMNGDNKVDYVYFALPKEFDEETCNLYKTEVRSCIHATCSFVSYTDLLLIAAERKQVLSVDIGASMLNVSLLRDNEVERTKSFILGSGYALDTAIVEFVKKEMGIVVNEEKRYVNVFLMQTAEKVRRTLDTAQEAQVDLTDISSFITCDTSTMTVRSNQLNTILGNYKKDLSFNIDLVRSIPGVDNSKSKLVLSGGMASQRFLKDCLGDLDKADEGLDKTLVTLQSLTLFFKKDQNAPLLTLSNPAEESADSFVIDVSFPTPNRVNDPPLIYSDPASSYRSTDSIQINSIPSDDVSEEVATPVNTQVPTPKPMSIMNGPNEIPLPMHPIQVTAVKKTDKPVSSYGVDVPSEPRVRIPTRLTSVGEDSLSNQGESMSPPDSPLLPAEKGQSPPMVPKAPLVQNPPARPTSPPPVPSVITTSFASPSPTDSIQTPHPMSFTSPEASLQGPTAVVVNDSTAPPSFYPISEKPQKPIAQSPYDIVDEKGNIIFAKGSPLSQIARAEVKATFYQLVFRKEFFKVAEQKERLGTCICQLERGLRGGTVLHVNYVLMNGNISFQVTYNHNGKTVKEERTMK
ncbi:hypothetical protein AV274_2777 [Blastocystis sp. ATCC 50177/Nand II]|uniref:Uncharacterized protein n=1 Tax=Blastocystis sp. subtype 1 (strain ATCC 50177 / NandII) TaxID=478820 RepID=A0A196SEK9_BLAHN|nr:hypothetical protein AV274_2777 [Blastocystis sp. ATCC 50177/Nand II]